MIRRSFLKPSSLPRRSAPPKVNRKRKGREFARTYHSEERVLFVRGLPCCACGVVGYSENAHVPPKGEAGTGYKADYRFIAPLCHERTKYDEVERREFAYIGCHRFRAERPWAFMAKFPDFDPEKATAETEAAWQSRISETEP